jgi:nucleoid-associated protein YgaU
LLFFDRPRIYEELSMKRGKQILGSVLCLAVVALFGCSRAGRMDERERDYRIVVKAYEMSNQGDFDSAIALFTKAVEAYPKLARPHLDLALLLQDRKQEHVQAIYHYSRYLTMRPGTEKTAMIERRIRLSELAFAALHTPEGSQEGIPVRELELKNARLEARNASLASRVEALEKELAELREELRQRYKAEVVGADSRPEEPITPSARPTPTAVAKVPPPAVVKRPTPVSAPAPETVKRPAPEPRAVVSPVVAPRPQPRVVTPVRPRPAPLPRREVPTARARPTRATAPVAADPVVRTYTVRPGDSLSKIAFKVYGDATQWRRLQNANRESLGDSVNVKVGQVLVVP